MRSVFYVLLALVLVGVETVFPRLAGLEFARPMLALALVLHLALVADTVEGAALACFAGFLIDASGGRPSGLSASAMVAVFVVARVVLLGVATGGIVVELALSALMVVAYHAFTWSIAQSLGPALVPAGETPWLAGTAWSVLATVLATPVVRWVGRRIEHARPREPGTLA